MNPTSQLCDDIERAAFADMVAAAPEPLRRALGLEAVAVGPGTALACRSGGLLVNRAIGVGGAHLAAAVEVYRRRGIERFFVHLYEGDAAAARAVGLERYPRAWVKLLRGDGPVPEMACDLVVGAAAAGDGEAAGRIYAAGFDLPEPFAAVIAALVGRPGWDVLVARDGAALAGVGLLYCRDGVGYLAGGTTAPAYRRRGVQGWLVAVRVRRAVAGGCRFVATETGEAVDGDPQHSFRNLIRCGFEGIGRRENFAPAGVLWNHGRG